MSHARRRALQLDHGVEGEQRDRGLDGPQPGRPGPARDHGRRVLGPRHAAEGRAPGARPAGVGAT
eukprot:2733893-Alexandrium_andersonii.AAC.1